MAKHINIKNKKKFIGLIIAAVAVIAAVVLVIVLLTGKKDDPKTESGEEAKYDEVVADCITELKTSWGVAYDGIEPLFDNGTFESEGKEDRVIEIKNTRIIEIKANKKDAFKNVKYIVEFDLYSNRYRTAPYLMREEVFNTAIVYKDGTTQILHTNTINSMLDQSEPEANAVREIVSNVVDLGDRYNNKIDLN